MARTRNPEVQNTAESSPEEVDSLSSSTGEEDEISDSSERSSQEAEEECSDHGLEPSNQEESDQEEDCDDDEEEQQPQQPDRFYLGPQKYNEACKLSTRCWISKTVAELKKTLNDLEMDWFMDDQNQFKHIIHMPKERTRKCRGFWMLCLRTVRLAKQHVWWFVVNGVPVRYSLWEHGLISGLNCREYPKNYTELGSLDFVKRQFNGRESEIKLSEVEKELTTMVACEDRLKMAVLYFLASMMKTHSKAPEVIDPFLLRIVDNLEECKKFPWGRYTFEDCSHELEHMFEVFKGKVRKSWTFPGFIVPLELLAYEAIPSLKKEYRKDVPAGKDCPRMCKRRFVPNGMSGYPLEDLNKALGDSKDIFSILEASLHEERYLMSRIWDRDFCGDNEDVVADGIMAHLSAGKKVFWEELYKQDVAARAEEKAVPEDKSVHDEADPLTPPPCATSSPEELWEMMKTMMENGFKSMMSWQEMSWK